MRKYDLSPCRVYVAGWLVARQDINLLPGAIAVIVQVIIGFLWAIKAKQYFLNHVEPQKCLLLYDGDISDKDHVTGRAFASKIEQHSGHVFDIEENCPVVDVDDVLFGEVEKYHVIFLYEFPLEKRSKVTRYCVDTGKRIYITPTVEDIVTRGYDAKHFIDTPLFAYNSSFKVNQTYFGKRALDVIFSLLMLVIASPIMIITAITIKLEDGGAGDIIGTTKKITQLCTFCTA